MYNVHTMKNISAKKLLMYAGTLFLVVVSIVAIILAIGWQRTSGYPENTINVSGKAEVSAVPDVARFSFTVLDNAKSTEEAQATISEKVSVILDGLEEVGVDEKDIKTNSYRIMPRYEYVRTVRPEIDIAVDGTEFYPGNDRTRKQTGFDVSQSVTVTVHDFDIVPAVLNILGDTGVENLNGPNFEIDDPEALQEEAREQAIDEAKEKAQRLAKDLGVRLGDIVSFNENNGGYPQPYYARTEMSMAGSDMAEKYAPELPTGENEITSQVTIVYEIK